MLLYSAFAHIDSQRHLPEVGPGIPCSLRCADIVVDSSVVLLQCLRLTWRRQAATGRIKPCHIITYRILGSTNPSRGGAQGVGIRAMMRPPRLDELMTEDGRLLHAIEEKPFLDKVPNDILVDLLTQYLDLRDILRIRRVRRLWRVVFSLLNRLSGEPSHVPAHAPSNGMETTAEENKATFTSITSDLSLLAG